MADQEHLGILKQGVKAWSEWRKANPAIRPDLSYADLSGAVLSYADLGSVYLNYAVLSYADLGGANLLYANLLCANLRGANLKYANLRSAELGSANLINADLGGVDITNAHLAYADLGGAKLINADLGGAKLSYADLSHTDLGGAKLFDADLGGAKLSYADLKCAKLADADLKCADLSGANLSRVDLSRADLRSARCPQADFSDARLAEACLIGADLSGATLNRTHLWETQRTGWTIKGVVCESVYFDKEGEEITSFGPGDFERLYSDKTKVILFYKGGISSLEFSTLPALVKHLEQSYPGCSLRLESINDASGGAVVTLAVDDAGDNSPDGLKRIKTELEEAAKQAIEFQRRALVERETRLQLEGEVKQLNSVVDKLILRPSVIFHNQGDTSMGDTYKIGQGIAGKQVHAHDMIFNQIGGQIEQSMDLLELAGELSQLRQAMSQEAKETGQFVALGEVAKAEEAAKAKDSSKVAESLKGAGRWALDVATRIGVSLATEAIKQSTGMK